MAFFGSAPRSRKPLLHNDLGRFQNTYVSQNTCEKNRKNRDPLLNIPGKLWYNTRMNNTSTTYQVQTVHDRVLSSDPLVIGKLVYFTGTLEECKAHKIDWIGEYRDTIYKARSTTIREVSQ